MSTFHPEFELLVRRLSSLPGISGILLGGSRVRGAADASSDYDLYVYTTQYITPNERSVAYTGLFTWLELNNTYWETEDDAVFLDCAVPIDIIWRDVSNIRSAIASKFDDFHADTGYTTCLAENIASSLILFDRTGELAGLQEKVRGTYPLELAQAIIAKNRPLLRGRLPSFSDQILKAFTRGDLVSVNHRIAAFVASWFDVLFALNQQLHPGEKRMVAWAQTRCAKLPTNFANDLEQLLGSAGLNNVKQGKEQAGQAIQRLCDGLDAILAEAELLPDGIDMPQA